MFSSSPPSLGAFATPVFDRLHLAEIGSQHRRAVGFRHLRIDEVVEILARSRAIAAVFSENHRDCGKDRALLGLSAWLFMRVLISA